MLNNFPRDTAKIIKQNSSVIDDVMALFDRELILIEDGSLPIEEGDIIERTLPSGLKEQYLVTDRGFCNAFHGFPAHYQIKFEKLSNYRKAPQGSVINNYVISDTDKVNINSTDNSVTVYNLNEQDKALFETLKTLAEQLPNGKETQEIISDMEASIGKKTFAERYNVFIQSVANHMTIFSPFIPALTQFLTK